MVNPSRLLVDYNIFKLKSYLFHIFIYIFIIMIIYVHFYIKKISFHKKLVEK